MGSSFFLLLLNDNSHYINLFTRILFSIFSLEVNSGKEKVQKLGTTDSGNSKASQIDVRRQKHDAIALACLEKSGNYIELLLPSLHL